MPKRKPGKCTVQRGRDVPQYMGADGFVYVDLWKDGVKESRRIHELVALTFNGPCPQGFEVYHLDGDRTNNRLDNLGYRVAGLGE